MNRVRLSVKVIPSSSRDRIVGWHRNALKVKVQAPPEKEKPTARWLRILPSGWAFPRTLSALKVARLLGIQASGNKASGNKGLVIQGITTAEVNERIDQISA